MLFQEVNDYWYDEVQKMLGQTWACVRGERGKTVTAVRQGLTIERGAEELIWPEAKFAEDPYRCWRTWLRVIVVVEETGEKLTVANCHVISGSHKKDGERHDLPGGPPAQKRFKVQAVSNVLGF